MKNFIFRFWIVILTFTFGVTATIIWLRYIPFVELYDKVNLAEIPFVEYCDLRNNPRKYNGKIIRINARLNWFMHGYFLADENCSGEGDSARTAIDVYEPKRDLLWETLKQFKESGKMWKPVKIIAVGRFSYKNWIGGSDHIQDRTPLQFEIYEIESASR